MKTTKPILVMMRTVLLAFALCPLASGAYQGFILFQTVPAKAGPTPVAPYTLLISGTFPALATVSAGGHVVNTVACGVNSITCPADLIFSKDSVCATPFGGWEILSWSPTTGQLTATVQIPILSNSRPAKVYVCAGDSSVTTFQGGAKGATYDSNYLLAFHMDETSGAILHDSTANANDAVKKGAANPSPTTAGKLGGGQRFTGTANSLNNDYALFNNPTQPTNTYTIEYWTNALTYINQDAVFLQNHGSAGGPAIYTGFFWYPSGTVVFKNSYNSTTPSAAAAANTGTFHSIVYVRSGNTMNLYLDGVAGTAASGFGTGSEIWRGFGWDGGPSPVFNSFNGVLDELYYSNIARSPDYLRARYNNLSSPSTFYTASAFIPLVVPPGSTTQANSQVNIF